MKEISNIIYVHLTERRWNNNPPVLTSGAYLRQAKPQQSEFEQATPFRISKLANCLPQQRTSELSETVSIKNSRYLTRVHEIWDRTSWSPDALTEKKSIKEML